MNSSFRIDSRFWTSATLTIALFLIAASIGSGWIFLLSDALLAALLCAVFVPPFFLKNITLKAQGPSAATAGDAFTVRVELKRKWGSPLLLPEYLLVRHLVPSAGDNLKDWKRATDSLLVECLDGPTTLEFVCRGLPRGVHTIGTVILATAFPAGMIWHRRVCTSDAQIIVYPQWRKIEGTFLYRIRPSGRGFLATTKKSSHVQAMQTAGIRPYRRGDSPRSIHWSSTARTGRLMVREYDAEGTPYFDVCLDLTAAWQSQEQFELAVSVTASLIALGQRLALAPELRFISHNPAVLQAQALDMPTYASALDRFLEILARVNPEKQAKSNQATQGILTAADQTPGDKRALLLVCPAGHDTSAIAAVNQAAACMVVEIGEAASASSLIGESRVLISSLEQVQRL